MTRYGARGPDAHGMKTLAAAILLAAFALAARGMRQAPFAAPAVSAVAGGPAASVACGGALEQELHADVLGSRRDVRVEPRACEDRR